MVEESLLRIKVLLTTVRVWYRQLVQLRVLRLGVLQDGDVGSSYCGSLIRRGRSVAHVLGKLQIECVYLLIADITDH